MEQGSGVRRRCRLHRGPVWRFWRRHTLLWLHFGLKFGCAIAASVARTSASQEPATAQAAPADAAATQAAAAAASLAPAP